MKKIELQQKQQGHQQLSGNSFQTPETPLLETKEVLIGKAKMSLQQIDQLNLQQAQLLQQQANFQEIQLDYQMILDGQQMSQPSTQNQQKGLNNNLNQQQQPTKITDQFLSIEMTPAQQQRNNRKIEERTKFLKIIPQEDPNNLIIESGYQRILFNLGQCAGCCGQYFSFCPNPNVQVNHYSKGIFERFGKYVKTVDSGLHFVNPYTDKLIKMDCRTLDVNFGMQSSITQDNIVLLVHGLGQYRVIDCRQAHYSVESINKAVKELGICALRSTISSMKYQSILDDRLMFTKRIEQFIGEYIQDWGIVFEQVIIKEMSMDAKTQDSLSSAAKEMRLAQAKILNAKADVAAVEEQRKAIDQLSSKSAMQIRFLNTLEKIASKSKVVFLAE